MSSTYHRPTAVLIAATVLAATLAATAVVCASAIASPRRHHPGPGAALVITGAGAGHGVGMSQAGALGFAEHGYAYRSILAHYYTGTTLGGAPPGSVVRVLLAGNRTRASLWGASLVAGQALNPASTYTVVISAHGVTLRGAGVRITARSLSVSGPSAMTLESRAENGLANGAYRGTLSFVPALHGGMNVINTVGLEDYVRGTIAAEMPSAWPAAALQAQAVASRTYAITARSGPADEFDVYCDTRSQLYDGVSGETARTNAAAAATASEIVTYRGVPAITYFFASSGGRTEDVQNAFQGSAAEPWLRGVPDPYDEGPQHSWTITMSFQSAAARLAGLVRGSFAGIEVLRRGYSPRVLSAYVLGSQGHTLVSGGELAARLGLNDTWAYFSVRTPRGQRAEPDLSSSGASPPDGPAAPSGENPSVQGGTRAE